MGLLEAVLKLKEGRTVWIQFGPLLTLDLNPKMRGVQRTYQLCIPAYHFDISTRQSGLVVL